LRTRKFLKKDNQDGTLTALFANGLLQGE